MREGKVRVVVTSKPRFIVSILREGTIEWVRSFDSAEDTVKTLNEWCYKLTGKSGMFWYGDVCSSISAWSCNITDEVKIAFAVEDEPLVKA